MTTRIATLPGLLCSLLIVATPLAAAPGGGPGGGGGPKGPVAPGGGGGGGFQGGGGQPGGGGTQGGGGLQGGGNQGGGNQGGGGFQGGGGQNGGWWSGQGEWYSPTWAPDLKSALGQKKPVLVYIHAPSEDTVPGVFRTPDIARASRETAVFVSLPLKESEPAVKELNVRSAPTVLMLDTYGNEWKRQTNLTQSIVVNAVRDAAADIARYEEFLDKNLEQAKIREDKSDDRAALFYYRKVAVEPRKGYEQIAAAREKIRQLSEQRLKDAVALLAADEKKGLDELSNLVREFDKTPVGARAKLAQIRWAVDQGGDLKLKIDDLQKLADLDGPDMAPVAKEAQAVLTQVEDYAGSLVEHARAKAQLGDADGARALLRRVTADFPGTKASRQANQDLAKF